MIRKIFYCINEERLAREAREEAVRKREEEMRRKEELRERYNKEVADAAEYFKKALYIYIQLSSGVNPLTP